MGGMVITGVVMLRQSLSQRESDEAAATDTLTGLPNRGRLNQVLARALDRAARSGQRSAVLLIDLNGFKQINDTLGHQVGDGLLTAVADAMRRCVRGGDLIGRLGGDEFAVVLPVIGGDHDAMAVAERITDALAEPVVVGGEPLQASASIGAAVCEPGELTPDALLHRADVAMYVAKRGKRHRPELWTPGVQDAAADDESLEADLGRALAAGQLSLCYQPLVDMVTGEIAGVEALARWHHPVRGEIGPAVFIPVAERTGAIDEIGRWVLEQAASQAGRWRGPGRTPYLSVNLSPRQLDRPDLVPAIRSILDRAGLDPRNLVLELTETALVQENSDVDHLRALRELGIRIAIDDFGIGYSSLRYLTRLPVDILKLDGCFTAELNGQPSGSAVAEAVLRLGQSLGLDVVAEGVETAGQANELTVLGYRIGQGYRFAYPMTADDVADRVAADRTAVQDR
jgi:diguanylate cyclase (GGDEF)-like protein